MKSEERNELDFKLAKEVMGLPVYHHRNWPDDPQFPCLVLEFFNTPMYRESRAKEGTVWNPTYNFQQAVMAATQGIPGWYWRLQNMPDGQYKVYIGSQVKIIGSDPTEIFCQAIYQIWQKEHGNEQGVREDLPRSSE